MGGYLEYHGGVQYHRGYHNKCRDILSTVGVFSTVGDIMSTVGVILSTVGDTQYCGGYHEYRGGYLEYRRGYSVPWGIHDARGDIVSTVGVFNTVGDTIL